MLYLPIYFTVLGSISSLNNPWDSETIFLWKYEAQVLETIIIIAG